jgi:hypothetical protein
MHIALTLAAAFLALSAPNPVLPGVADAGVLRHAGRYYIMGVGTSGGVHVSKDLVHWSGPVHAFSMQNAWATGDAGADREIHACDFLLHDGQFHLHWSVNHGALRQIGHAVASAPAGPYLEPVRERPLDGRIDPQCFRDDDGSLYLYTVKFEMGNFLWGQPMADPGRLTGEATRMLWPLHRTWETLDGAKGMPTFINEGPFVVKYRERYYLMYNANHTGGEYGNYALGVAETDGPLRFNNRDKYPFPVLRSNRDPRHVGVEPSTDLPEIKNCGQPNLVRGPNGLDWWLVYFADQQGRRAQYIDRAHIFGRELYVEGPTSAETPGYHPSPSMPTFLDTFEAVSNLADRWQLPEGARGEADQLHLASAGGMQQAMPKIPAARSYVLETVLTFDGQQGGRAGVVAWKGAEDTAVYLLLDRAAQTFGVVVQAQGEETVRVLPQPGEFVWTGPHALRVENNAGSFVALLDGVRYEVGTLTDKMKGPGVAGLVAEGCTVAFDSFQLTRGWDESGVDIRGWRQADGTAHPADSTRPGLTLPAGTLLQKGDPLAQYEFSLQVHAGAAISVYPVYADAANQVRVGVDAAFTGLQVTGMRDGVALPETRYPIHPRVHRAHSAESNGNHLRMIKRHDRVLLFAEGLLVGEIEGAWPDSNVALLGEAEGARVDHLTLFEMP